GYPLKAPFALGGTGGTVNDPGLISGDPDGSTRLLGTAYVQSTSLGSYANTLHDLTFLLRVKRQAVGSTEQWLWDGRETSTRTNLNVSLAATSGLLKLYRATTLLLTSSAGITDTQPHTVLVRAWHVVGSPSGQRRLEVWLDGALVGQTDITQQWSQYSRRSTIGAKFDGTSGFNGW